ncbi:MAG: PAS domain S-box protein [Desulfamplus sp.]|nr:PAS domain S-box protein [Desulfamplus sp.]
MIYEGRGKGRGDIISDILKSDALKVMEHDHDHEYRELVDALNFILKSDALKLREQETQYRELVEALNVGVYRITSDNKTFLQANPAAAQIFGYDSLDEFMKTSLCDHYKYPQDRELMLNMLQKRGFCKNLEFQMFKKDGSTIWVSFNLTVKYKDYSDLSKVSCPLTHTSHEDRIRWIDGVVEDITERKELINRLKRLNSAYERFVPHEFLQILGKKSIEEVQLNDRIEKEMSILFSDIRQFCTFSEAMTTEDNFRFINSYLSHMGPIVKQHNGFIDKFIGDSIMALFGGDADDALSAAVMMLKTLKDYNEGRNRAGYIPVQIGIGINTGRLMLGTLGESHRMEGTVIGDAVNVASRLEKLTKHYNLPLLISEYTLKALKDRSRYKIRFVDNVLVKGKSRPIAIYEVFL